MRLSICLLLVVFSLSCSRPTPVLEKDVNAVRVSTVESYTPNKGQRYSASILPNRQVNLAFRTSGFVESIHQVRGADGRLRSIDIGDVVEAGTTLAQVRVSDYQLQVSQIEGQAKQASSAEQTARAQLAQAQTAALKAEQDFARADALFQRKSLTKSDYDAAKANYDAAQAQVKAANSQVAASAGASSATQAALATAQLGLRDTSLAAPFKAVIVQRSIEIGALAGPAVPAFTVADISSVKAAVAVPDFLVAQLRQGSMLSVYTEAFPSRRFRGSISAVAAAADSNTRAFQVNITIPNERGLLRPGMIASLDFGPSRKSPPVTVAPLNAIVRAADDSSQFAVVVVNDGIARRKPVTLGATFGDRIAVTGIDPGERIVSSGAALINDGDSVRVIP